MSKSPQPRADAVRNRERLMAVARARFAAGEVGVPLDALAREAGVGIGTLYRHFPTRQALVEAVYGAELDALDADAEALLAGRRAIDALRIWMDRYAAFVVAKHAMMDALRLALAAGSGPRPETRARVQAQVARLMAAGVADGTIRGDADAADVALAMAGMVLAATTFQGQDRLAGLLDLLVDGLDQTTLNRDRFNVDNLI